MAANIRCIMRAKAPYGQGITKMKVKLTPEQSSTPSLMPETKSVYLSRPTEGTGELMELVGGAVAWNQLVQNGDFSDGTTGFTGGDSTLSASGGVLTMTATSTANRRVQFDISAPNGHKVLFHARFKRNSNESSQTLILLRKSGGGFDQYTRGNFASTAVQDYWAVIPTTDVITQCLFYPMQTGAVGDTVEIYSISVCDLTQWFDPIIANYVYSMEQQTAGSGIQWLQSWDFFTEDYIPYSAATLQSVEATAHVTVGFNRFDKTTAVVGENVRSTNGTIQTKPNTYSRTDYIPVIAGERYYISNNVPQTDAYRGAYYDASKNYVDAVTFEAPTAASATSGITLAPANARYMIVNYYTADVDSLCINISDPDKNGTYKPYVKHTTPLANITLRGILNTEDNGNLYYYGDTYSWDGTVTRRFAEVDLGTLNWAKIMSGEAVYFSSATALSPPYKWVNYNPNVKCRYQYAGIGNTGTANGITIIQTGYVRIRDDALSSGDAAAFKTAMNGVKLVYELATETTESADPFTAVQTVEDGGTEEFTTSNGVPVGVIGRFANAVPMEGVDSFTVTADDGTTHTYPVTLSEEVYSGYVDMLTGDAVSDMASIAEYNGETIATPWLSSLDVYSSGATPTKGAQVVYPITPEEVTAIITGDPSSLSGVSSVSSTEGTVDWSELSEIGIKCIMKQKIPFQ